MRLPNWIVYWLLRRVKLHMVRMPDVIIGSDNDPYLKRWYLHPRSARRFSDATEYKPLIGNWLGIYIHQFIRSDDDRALHDHPRHNLSIVIDRGFWEHIHGKRVWRYPGQIVFRRATTLHRIELEYQSGVPRFSQEAISLFITGPRIREWGFACPKGWVPWYEFTRRGVVRD